MFSKEVIKITALSIFFFLTFQPIFNQKVQAFGSNCKEFYGSFYIADEFYRACGIYVSNPNQCPALSSLNAYSTESSCNNASIQRYGCTPNLAESVFYTDSLTTAINYDTNKITIGNALSCIESRQNNTTSNLSFCRDGVKFVQCKCSKTLVGEAGAIGEVVSWITGSETYSCYLKPIIGNNFVKLKEIKYESPLALIKTIADTLFYAAIVIFIVNILRAGSQYVQSEGEPDTLKKGRTLLSNAISGMIFLLLVSGLINYLINVFRI
jgi:hypothetical protein